MRRTLSHFSVSYSENDSDSDDCQCSDGAMFVCKQQRLDRRRHRRSLNQLRLQLQPAHLRWFSFSGWPAALSYSRHSIAQHQLLTFSASAAGDINVSAN
jgi:hypothetical protein